MEKELPILEFSDSKDVYITPEHLHEFLAEMPKTIILCFFNEAIKYVIDNFPSKVISNWHTEGLQHDIYVVNYKGKEIALTQAGVGAPQAASLMEDLSAMGCVNFICIGACGVLQKDLVRGHLIVPTCGVRDEGTSYHYIPPSYEIEADKEFIDKIIEQLGILEVPFVTGKTWTTDAYFRETKEKVELRKKQGCITVEMEFTACMAVAKHKDLKYGQILYAGDSLAGDVWDSRGWQGEKLKAITDNGRIKVLELLLEVSIKI